MINVPGYTPPTDRGTGALINQLAPDFFAAMEMPLILGRGFTERDTAAAPKVAVVNQAFVNRFFREENPIGRTFMWSGGPDKDIAIEIVGVTRDAKFTDLRDTLGSTIYTPMLQAAEPDGIANFALRVSGDPAAVFPAIRTAVREIDSTLPVLNLRTQDEQLDRLNAGPLLFARLSGFFGSLALGLACVGLYGLMSYQVLRRTSEIGLRMALGALPAQVLRMILRESLGLIGLGVALGVAVACAASRLVAAMLFGLAPIDAPTYGSAALLLVLVALAACLLPARRAAKVDPIIALRAE
jgi:predicted permease